MTAGVLNFDLVRPDWLNFGRASVSIPDNDWTLDATLPAPGATFTFNVVRRLRRAWRVRQSSADPWAYTARVRASAAQPQAGVAGLTVPAGRPVQETLRAESHAGHPTENPLRLGRAAGCPFAASARLARAEGHPTGTVTAVREAAGQPLIRLLSTPLHAGQPLGMHWRMVQSSGQPTPCVVAARFSAGVVWQPVWSVWRDQALLPPHGWHPPPYVPPLPGKRAGRLAFLCLRPGALDFGHPCFGAGHLLVAIKRSYRVLNTASLIRVSDSVDIPVTQLSVSLDWDSWCWTLSASVPTAAAAALVPAYPGTVRATINGFAWDFIVDEVSWNRAFATYSATLQGRSPAAIYAEPYALAKTYREAAAKTAEQLALQELGPGWALDWQLPMWTVPGGVFQYDNLTIIETLNRIVRAAGGWLYADEEANVLHAVPKWPQKPWAWTFLPDASLPSSYVLSEAQQPVVSSVYESILISGGVEGLAVLATRAGTGGATVAPPVVDTLITAVEPATARAVQELADLWPMKRYTLTLPLQASPEGAGLLLPGTTFDFIDGAEDGFRGVVSGVSISAGWNDVKQTLEILAP